MTGYNKLFSLYREAVPHPLDPQVLLQCEAFSYVPLNTLIPQYKWLACNDPNSKEYRSVQQYLKTIFGTQTMIDLEALQDAGRN